MQQINTPYPLMISVVVTSAAQLAAVYALLGSTTGAADLLPGKQQRDVQQADNAKQDTVQSSAGVGTQDQESLASAGTGPAVTSDASPSEDDGEVDAHGHPWSAELHASTKGKTKEGLWRMKPGATRPEPLPGFPVESAEDTGTKSETPTPSATSQAATEPASAPATTSVEEEDEFAAFRDAAAKSDAVDQAAAADVPARTYSDADLGALCNQAAVKLGDPAPIKEIITKYVPEGEIAHSRNIPEDKRADFVKEVEAKAGIEFVG